MTPSGREPGRELPWGPSLQARVLVVVSVLLVGAALLTRRVELLVLAAPSVWALLSATRQPEAGTLHVTSSTSELRGRETEPLAVTVRVAAEQQTAWLGVALALPAQLDGRLRKTARDQSGLTLTGDVLPLRWGRHRVGPLRVSALTGDGLRAATTDVPLRLEALVLPRAEPLRSASAPPLLRDRLGEHVTRAAGQGVEPVGVRAFVPGDAVRRINWRVSSRRQRLHVMVAAAERAVDLVLVVDALSDAGVPPDTTLDRGVRHAAAIAERWLRERDTVGLLVLGGALRWLRPAAAGLQRQRVAEAVLWAWPVPSDIAPDVALVPRTVVPRGAVVVVLTPLLDERALQAVHALRRRASHVLVVDTLGDVRPEPVPDRYGELAARLWGLDRAALVDGYRRSGVPVLQPAGGELDRLLALALRRAR